MRLSLQQQAESLIRDTGARLTGPHTRELAFLLKQDKPLTHRDIHEQLKDDPFDAATLYRVLEWLTVNGLVHRIASADQVWRFSAKVGGRDHDHAHFHCTSYDAVTCFNDGPLPRRVKVSAGFTRQEVDLLIKGVCPHCSSG
jgi:Fur family ferric uptake transcriptional regulator